MFRDVDAFFDWIKKIPLWVKCLFVILVFSVWLIGQQIFVNSQNSIRQSSVYKRVEALLTQKQEVASLVGEKITMSFVIGDPKKRYFIVKLVGDKSYTFAKANFIDNGVSSLSLKVADSNYSLFPEYMRGKWVQLKI